MVFLRQTDMCDPAGCLYELCLMLSIYMIGRQVFSNSMELYFPKFKNWFRKFLYVKRLRNTLAGEPSGEEEERSGGDPEAGDGPDSASSNVTTDDNELHPPAEKREGSGSDAGGSASRGRAAKRRRVGGGGSSSVASSGRGSSSVAPAKPPKLKRWEADYQLEEIDRLHLFDEYIEMGQSHLSFFVGSFSHFSSCIVYSHPVRLRDFIRGCVPACSPPGPPQQRVRDPPGRVQVHGPDAQAPGTAGQGHRDLVQDPGGDDIPVCGLQREK